MISVRKTGRNGGPVRFYKSAICQNGRYLQALIWPHTLVNVAVPRSGT